MVSPGFADRHGELCFVPKTFQCFLLEERADQAATLGKNAFDYLPGKVSIPTASPFKFYVWRANYFNAAAFGRGVTCI